MPMSQQPSPPLVTQSNVNQPAPVKPGRLVSLDALRGFDMFWIMSGEHIVHALAQATGWPALIWMSSQLHHAEWNGCTFYDMIFPLFLFIAGVSMPFSLQGKLQRAGLTSAEQLSNQDKWPLYRSMLKRTLILIVLGMIVNGFLEFKAYEQTRIASVLGRIGLAWLGAGIIYLNTSTRGQILWAFAILLGYWAAMTLIPVPGFGAGVLTPEGALSSFVDRILLPGKLHRTVYDPEGLFSTIPAITTALLGMLTGTLLKDTHRSMTQKTLVMLGLGVVLILLGLLWDQVFPINKRLWTSSFAVFVGGWSLLFLAIFYYIIDVKGFQKWTFPFILIGTNSILIYLASDGIIDFAHTAHFLFNGFSQFFSANWQPVIQSLAVTGTQLLLLYALHRNKLFLKI